MNLIVLGIRQLALLRCVPLAGDQLKLEEAGGESMLFQVLY